MLSQFYYPLKHLHISLVTISILLFNARYWFLFYYPQRILSKKWRIIPPVIDTALLIVGILLATIIYAIPFTTAQWLGFKLLILFFYIVFGAIAMRSQRRSTKALTAYTLAMLCVGSMVYLAYFKPLFW